MVVISSVSEAALGYMRVFDEANLVACDVS